MQSLFRGMFLVAVTAVLIPILFYAEAPSAETPSGTVTAKIKIRTENPRRGLIACQDAVPCRSRLLKPFYIHRGFKPAWSRDQGLLPASAALVAALRDAANQGFRPVDYHLTEIEGVLSELGGMPQSSVSHPSAFADLDLLLTDAFLLYAADLGSGKTDPAKVEPGWHISRNRPGDLAGILQNALETGDVGQALRGLLPPDPWYARLAAVLASYREIAGKGGWPRIPSGKTLKKGDRDSRVAMLRERLAATGDLAAPVQYPDKELFDGALEDAVARFQKRHGLGADGQAGRRTVTELNVSAAERIRQIEVNMERWRWLPRNFGENYIFVNIPGFRLDVMENDRVVLSMEIIVGKAAWSTPIFQSRMTDVVFNPYWHVPPSIAVKEVIPRIRRDHGYLSRENIKIIDLRTGRFVSPQNVNWAEAMKGRYRFRQESGPKDALGRIKFLLPNPFDVFLHDTPEKHLFERAARGFSHGCIRIEKPLDLAVYLFRRDPQWNKEKIISAIDTGKTRQVKMPSPVETYVVYFTAWVDGDGTVQFREDLYKRDPSVAKALERAP